MKRAFRCLSLALAVCLVSGILRAQEASAYRGLHRPPDVMNARYGPHERNVLDLWKADGEGPRPLVVYIHGGGFVAGDKTGIRPELLKLCLDHGMSVASINYRFVTRDPYPAPMLDGVRAVQYLRQRAAEWNLDPARVAASGGSAGAAMSLWIGYHDDLADTSSGDPVMRQSSRLSCMGVFGAQSTLDPREISLLVSPLTARHPSFEAFYGIKGEEYDMRQLVRLFQDASPLNHVTPDDPPAFLYYAEADADIPDDAKPGAGIHHPRFGRLLEQVAGPAGVGVVVRHADEYREDPLGTAIAEMVAFFRIHLR